MQPFGENTANIPAFLGKLWKMVNDPSIDHLICWSPVSILCLLYYIANIIIQKLAFQNILIFLDGK